VISTHRHNLTHKVAACGRSFRVATLPFTPFLALLQVAIVISSITNITIAIIITIVIIRRVLFVWPKAGTPSRSGGR